jgi:hypothetical protein
MNFVGGYTQIAGDTMVEAGATLQGFLLSSMPSVFIQGGTVRGSGSISGFVINGAIVHPGASPGILTIMDGYPTPYTQSPTGTLVIDIGGLTVGTQYSRLVVSGAAVLNGTLEVNMINGFLPSLGDAFSIMTFNSSSGSFSAVTGNHLANGLVLVPRYSTTNVTLVATKELQPFAPAFGSNRFGFSFSSEAGFSYVVEYTDALGTATQWQTLTNIAGTGSILSAVDPSANVPKRFYRVRVQ